MRFRLFGFDIFTIEWGNNLPLELEQPAGITGGAAHDFEREPEVYEVEERLGFRANPTL